MKNSRLKELLDVLKLKGNVLDQGDFGIQLGVSRSHLSQVLNGKLNLSADLANKICYKYKVSKHWLFDGVGSMFEDENIILPSTAEEGSKYEVKNLNDRYIKLLEKSLADAEQREKDVIEREKLLLSSLVTQQAFDKLRIRTAAFEQLTLGHLSRLTKLPHESLAVELGRIETDLTNRHSGVGKLHSTGI